MKAVLAAAVFAVACTCFAASGKNRTWPSPSGEYVIEEYPARGSNEQYFLVNKKTGVRQKIEPLMKRTMTKFYIERVIWASDGNAFAYICFWGTKMNGVVVCKRDKSGFLKNIRPVNFLELEKWREKQEGKKEGLSQEILGTWRENNVLALGFIKFLADDYETSLILTYDLRISGTTAQAVNFSRAGVLSSKKSQQWMERWEKTTK